MNIGFLLIKKWNKKRRDIDLASPPGYLLILKSLAC